MSTTRALIAGLAIAALGMAAGTGSARADGGITLGTIIAGVAGVSILHHLENMHTAYPSTVYLHCYPGTQDCIRHRVCHYGEAKEYHCHFY